MKIERISDTQMKFVLMQSDLEERDIKISELSHSSDKTQQLFREIMQLVQDEEVFTSESAPFLIEAMRVGVDSLAMIVTKMNMEDLEKRYNLVPAAKGRCRYKRNGFIEHQSSPEAESHVVFSFKDMDLAATAAEAINPVFEGRSQLYKLDGQYYLWLLNETKDDRTTGDIESILHEFGQKHVSNTLSRQYLSEHGELIIEDDAVGKLVLYASMSEI